MLSWSRQFGFLGGLLLIAFLGCDPDYTEPNRLVEVHGEIYQDGQPVTNARVVFVPILEDKNADFTLSYGTTNSQGEFDLSLRDGTLGAQSGRHRVFISKVEFSVSQFADLVGAQPDSVDFQWPPDGENQPDIDSYDSVRHQLVYQVVPGRGIQRPRFELPSMIEDR